MTITAENIAQSHQVGQQAVDSLTALLLENIVIKPTDNSEKISRKIEALTLLKTYILNSVEIDDLPSDELQLNFIKLIAQLTEQIEAYELMIGRKNRLDLQRIGQRFASKTQIPIGFDS